MRPIEMGPTETKSTDLILRRRVAPSRRIDSGHDLAAVLRDADLRSPPQTRLMDNVDTTRTSETLY